MNGKQQENTVIKRGQQDPQLKENHNNNNSNVNNSLKTNNQNSQQVINRASGLDIRVSGQNNLSKNPMENTHNKQISNESQNKEQSIWHCLFVNLFEKKFYYQPSINKLIIIFGIVGVVFVVSGIIFSILAGVIVEEKVLEYEKSSNCKEDKNDPGICYYFFEVNETLEPPIFMFYQLDRFYQNHRMYMASKSSQQLAGEDISKNQAEDDCDPVVYNRDLWDGVQSYEIDGVKHDLDRDAIANPCGLIAKSFFNDTYELFQGNEIDQGQQIYINESGIAWNNDKDRKFKKIKDKSQRTKQWINPESEHFIIWMRTSSLPVLQKLWGRIEDVKLQKGQKYYFKIHNNYNIKQYKSTKGIILSTSNAFGGKNLFMGWAYIIVGIMCVLISVLFFFKKRTTGGAFGNQSFDGKGGFNNLD